MRRRDSTDWRNVEANVSQESRDFEESSLTERARVHVSTLCFYPPSLVFLPTTKKILKIFSLILILQNLAFFFFVLSEKIRENHVLVTEGEKNIS